MRLHRAETRLTDNDAAEAFGRVALVTAGDCSLVALFRAIVINHNQGESIEVINEKSAIEILRTSNSSDVDYWLNNSEYPMSIIYYDGDYDQLKLSPSNDWITYDTAPFYLNRYLSQYQRSKVYTNANKQHVFAIVENRPTHVWTQAFESMLWGILPWYYPSKSDETIAFFKSLSVRNDDPEGEEAKKVVIRYANEAASHFDFRLLRLHKMFDNIGNRIRDVQVKKHRGNIEYVMDHIDTLVQQLESEYTQLNTLRTILNALESKPDDISDEVYKFFESHKNIHVDSVDDSSTIIRYTVTDTLEYYDEDELERLFSNTNGWAYRGYESHLKYLRALFLEKRGIVRVSASFKLTNMSLVAPLKGEFNASDAMPNMHIYAFGCSGGNGQYYTKYAKSGDWDLGVEQSISATKNWNIGDSAVGRQMFSWLVDPSGTTPCIYVSDGSPIDTVTDGMALISYEEFRKLIDTQAEKKNEVTNNG